MHRMPKRRSVTLSSARRARIGSTPGSGRSSSTKTGRCFAAGLVVMSAGVMAIAVAAGAGANADAEGRLSLAIRRDRGVERALEPDAPNCLDQRGVVDLVPVDLRRGRAGPRRHQRTVTAAHLRALFGCQLQRAIDVSEVDADQPGNRFCGEALQDHPPVDDIRGEAGALSCRHTTTELG